MPSRSEHFLAVIGPAVRQAASIARALEGRVRNRPKDGEDSAAKAALTLADTAAQEAILVPLLEHFPDVSLLAEEDTPSVGSFPHQADECVVIDPIDGTLRCYLEAAGPYAVMVGLVRRRPLRGRDRRAPPRGALLRGGARRRRALRARPRRAAPAGAGRAGGAPRARVAGAARSRSPRRSSRRDYDLAVGLRAARSPWHRSSRACGRAARGARHGRRQRARPHRRADRGVRRRDARRRARRPVPRHARRRPLAHSLVSADERDRLALRQAAAALDGYIPV